MKYTIEGFSQAKLVEFKLNISDANILRWFVDFLPKMSKIDDNGITYYWVCYQQVINDLPALEITNSEVIRRRFDKFVNAGIMIKTVIKRGGSFSVFALTQKYLELVEHSTQKSTPLDPNIELERRKSRTGSDLEVEPKDSSIKNTSIKQTNTDVEQVTEVFEFWQKVMKKPKAKLDDKRSKLISTQLKSFSIEDLKTAIVGCSKSVWHMGMNPQKTEYNQISNIFSNVELVEKFIESAGKPKISTNSQDLSTQSYDDAQKHFDVPVNQVNF